MKVILDPTSLSIRLATVTSTVCLITEWRVSRGRTYRNVDFFSFRLMVQSGEKVLSYGRSYMLSKTCQASIIKRAQRWTEKTNIQTHRRKRTPTMQLKATCFFFTVLLSFFLMNSVDASHVPVNIAPRTDVSE